MKVKMESEKVGLKLNIQKMKIMASDPITSWEIDGETVETVSDFILFIYLFIYFFEVSILMFNLMRMHKSVNPSKNVLDFPVQLFSCFHS